MYFSQDVRGLPLGLLLLLLDLEETRTFIVVVFSDDDSYIIIYTIDILLFCEFVIVLKWLDLKL